MADPRIIHLDLDERTIVPRSHEVEQERRVAIVDLVEANYFKPARAQPDGYAGPYRLRLAAEEGRLALHIAREDGTPLELLVLALGRLRRLIRDYFAVCDSHLAAVRHATPHQIETVDMARRALHNEGAELLRERLGSRVDLDFDTARRLFTLICALHVRG